MKRDPKNEKLLDEQLSQVQGGIVGSGEKNTSLVFCLHPGCNWACNRLHEELEAAKQAHTNATGHNMFGTSKLIEEVSGGRGC